MATVHRYPNGTFCWTELAAADATAASLFYTELFGWEATPLPLGPNATYHMLYQDGRSVAALYQAGPGEESEHWKSFVAVDDVEAAARVAEGAGGVVIAQPFDVQDAGRMAILRDASGADLALWQGRAHIGAGRFGEPGAPCWFELATRDTEAAANFVQEVFGWESEVAPMGRTTYTTFTRKGEPVGGMLQMTDEWGEVRPHWMVYFQVDKIAATMRRAKELGGTVLYGPLEASGLGKFAIFRDPQGVTFSAIELYDAAA
ncbi:MAG: VOC family protein [Nannocystaceae bacterium]